VAYGRKTKSARAGARAVTLFRRASGTLQELIAPTSVEFFSKEGDQLSNKISLKRHIYKITEIPVEVL
jgi:hypothetical protein